MSKSKIAIFGNHSCSNRGDAAIARGLLTLLENEYPEQKLDFYTRYPDSARFILDEEPLLDPIYAYYSNRKGLSTAALVNKYLNKKYRAYARTIAPGRAVTNLFIPSEYRWFLRQLESYAAFIFVGGSFFVDLYGGVQLEALEMAVSKKVPVLLAGHSVGPFNQPFFRHACRKLLPQTHRVVLRETVSRDLMRAAEIDTENTRIGADTAWLVPADSQLRDAAQPVHRRDAPKVALTVRELAPFDSRLGVTQEEYEAAIARLCRKILDAGYEAHFVSMCTGLDNYTHDDRMVGLRIKARLGSPDCLYVQMGEPTDMDIGQFLSGCHCTVSTRLHSAIISMRFGTPALALAYEHKSQGIMEKLGYPNRVLNMRRFCDSEHDEEIVEQIKHAGEARASLRAVVEKEASLAKKAILEALEKCRL